MNLRNGSLGMIFSLLVASVACGAGGSGEPTKTPTVPGAPTEVFALPGNASALVTWTVPADDGGRAITSYEVTATPSAVTTTAKGTSLELTGLVNGTEYIFTVVARNSVGPGPASAPSPPAKPANVTTSTGVFADARTAGLRYESGGIVGYTGPGGAFRYQSGGDVAFSVGGVLVGTTSGRALVTPLTLVPGAATTDPVVARIAQFLQTLDSDGDPSNGIIIPWEAQLAASSLSVDLTTPDPVDVGSVLSGLTDRTTVDASTATAHLDDTMRAAFEGDYAGTFITSGDYPGGTWRVHIEGGGAISGTASAVGGVELPLSGQGDTSGGVLFSGTGVAGDSTFSGVLDPSTGHAAGTWTGSAWDPLLAAMVAVSGEFSGGRESSTYAGVYDGTYGGVDAGTWTATIAPSGTVTGTGFSVGFGQPFQISGSISGTGELEATLTAGGTSTGATWSASILFDGGVTGSWQQGASGGGGVVGHRR